jgi:hypothetical protein
VTEHDGTRDGSVPPHTRDTTDDTETATMYPAPMDPAPMDPAPMDPAPMDTATDAGVMGTGATEQPARRRGPDPLALLVGLATRGMAVFAFVGELPDLSGLDPRWLLAGGAAVVGLMLLVGSLRGRSGGRPDRS